MKKLIFLVTTIWLAGALAAIPYTASGSVNIPDAYCLPHLMMEFSYVNNFTENGKVPGQLEPYDEYDYAGVFRIGLFNRADLGFVYTSTAGFLANLKIKIIDETEVLPAFSIGCLNMFSEVRDNGTNVMSPEYEYPDAVDYIRFSPFGVISKSMVMVTGMRSMEYLEATFHLGMGARRFRGRGTYNAYATGILLGVEIKPARWLNFGFEIDGQDANIGLDFNFKNLAIGFGLYRFEDLVLADLGEKFAINIKYTLDALSEIKASDKRRKVPMSHYMDSRTYPGGEEGESLEAELERIRERRQQAEKELEEIRKLLQEQD